ncbi:MAG: hypothetical protein M5U31_16175 [Acidimicrobiia bacterium]|nr:hypothetical protein [Acidimicrobiia bacterium]
MIGRRRPSADRPETTHPLLAGIELSQAERLCAAALQEPNQHAAIRFLVAMLPEIEADLPGMRNAGMLACTSCEPACPSATTGRMPAPPPVPFSGRQGRELVEGLGFAVDTLV